MSSSTVSRRSTGRNANPTTPRVRPGDPGTPQHARQVDVAARISRGRTPLPSWIAPAGRFLQTLGLDPIQLSEVCRFLDRTKGDCQGMPILTRNHAVELQAVIDKHTPSASTPDTPHDPDAIIVDPADWTWWCEINRTEPEPKPATRNLKAERAVAAAMLSPQAARYISGERRGHYA